MSPEQGYEAARLTALVILASLKRELGDLDRVTAWLRVFGMVNSAPGFSEQPNVINEFSDLILEVYGPEADNHTRSAVGMAELLLGLPVEIEAEVEVRSDRKRGRRSLATRVPSSDSGEVRTIVLRRRGR